VHEWHLPELALQDLCRLSKLEHQFWVVSLLYGEAFLLVATAPLRPFGKRKILGIPSSVELLLEAFWLLGLVPELWQVLL
jgi:hypothetical protein